MKRLFTLLLLTAACVQAGIAQGTREAPETELLEIAYLDELSDHPLSVGVEWLRAQRDAWKAEVEKDKTDERAWDNYLAASHSLCVESNKDAALKAKLQKELKAAVRKMERCIPNTRVCYRHLMRQEKDKAERERMAREITSLKRTCERDYLDDMEYYRQRNRMEKIKEIAVEWYGSGLFSTDLLTYCYNELAGLERNGVLVCYERVGICYRYLLQYGMGLFTDIGIVTLSDLQQPEPENGSHSLTYTVGRVPGDDKFPGIHHLTEELKRTLYFSQSPAIGGVMYTLRDSLYSEGLALRYSPKPYSNMAITRRNYERVYLLDYLRQPWADNRPGISYASNLDGNYIVSFVPLLKFYHVSGDKNQYAKLKSLLEYILENYGKKIVNHPNAKMLNALIAQQLRMAEQGKGTARKGIDLKAEYRKLIDSAGP